MIGTVSQAAGTLALNSRQDTNLEIAPESPIWQYDATIDLGGGAGIPVVPETCYWLEIVNNIGNVGNWFWEWARIGPNQADPTAGPRQGNGRCLVDGVGDGVLEPDGYDFFNDTVAGNDLAFCIGLELAPEACGFGDHGTDTGPHEVLSFNGTATHLGWFSGDLDAGASVDDQRRTAQPFTLPPTPAGTNLAWSIEQVLLEGFDPGNVNEFINFEIFNRTALDVAPTDVDSVILIENVEFDNVFDLVTEEFGLIVQGLLLDPGDYWLTFWPSNSSGGLIVANVVWFSNAPNGINVVCTENMPPPAPGFEGCIPNDPGPDGDPAGGPAMLRSRLYPVPGFGAYTLDPAVLDLDPGDPTQDAADLYNTAFRLRMRAIEVPLTCPWDCGGDNDLDVGIVDFLELLGHWGPCP